MGNNHASQSVHETERREIILPIWGGAGLSEFSVQVSEKSPHAEKTCPTCRLYPEKIRNYSTEARLAKVGNNHGKLLLAQTASLLGSFSAYNIGRMR